MLVFRKLAGLHTKNYIFTILKESRIVKFSYIDISFGIQNMELPSIGDPLRDSWWPYIVALIVGIATCIRSYMGGNDCPSKQRIDGQVVIVTGASSGMGIETAYELANRGGKIILAVRDVKAGQLVQSQILKKVPNAEVDVKELDLASLKSVRKFVEELDCQQIDILVNNAGVVFCPFGTTEDGFETHLATNYLGHFLLTHLLLPKLKASPNSRVINVSAHAHYASNVRLDNLNLDANYEARDAFGQSKLALILMARHMAKKLEGTSVHVNALQPGLVRGTHHMRHSPLNGSYMVQVSMLPWMWLLMKTPIQGAQTAIYLAVSSDVADLSGKYFSDCELKEPSDKAKDDKLAAALYAKTCDLVGIDGIN